MGIVVSFDSEFDLRASIEMATPHYISGSFDIPSLMTFGASFDFDNMYVFVMIDSLGIIRSD